MLSPPMPTAPTVTPGVSGGLAAIDIVIAIDCSGSMEDEAKTLSDAAEAGLEKAKQSCPSDTKVYWLGVQGLGRTRNLMSTWSTI